ncbi:HAD-IIA family hydrolase [Paeniglutamicibacter cryotolerans]|uniref:HAD superfamily hydrolase (TIGR01450 family) n=1 Tax=Paeniglutamicibacter cryotolerans TaxID=670079 RepID=A0A839QKB2_9MICC|nr:HAD-IIA family hydrolase [Paeniglutamicibacter cryotolerans]MBB2996270.1 HAD superfamily hydrolase (TIGR01450 family) [Paeniglutamicibacter cryotolerans]
MLISGFDAVLTDLDGVVYAGAGAIEGAVESLDRLAGLGVSLAYVTNNASRSPEVVAGHLRALGVPARSDQVFDSASAGADLLAKLVEIGSVVLVVGSAYLRECVTARGMVLALSEHERIDAVIQGFDPTLGWKDLAAAAFAINKGALWVATNTDLTIPRAEGIAPGNGSLVAAVTNATGINPHVAGKPQPLLFQRAAERFESAHPLVIGDRLDTDILGGNQAGFKTAVVLTGVETTASLLAARTAERPDFILRDLTELYDAYPVLEATGYGIRCGSAIASVRDGRISVTGRREDLDAWRAACEAWWLAHPHVESTTNPEIEFIRGCPPPTHCQQQQPNTFALEARCSPPTVPAQFRAPAHRQPRNRFRWTPPARWTWRSLKLCSACLLPATCRSTRNYMNG